jgi:hypothetical protein
VSKTSDKSGIFLLVTFALCVVGGPAIFYGLVAMGSAGLLDFLIERVWLVAVILAVLVLGWSFAVLYVGNKVMPKEAEREETR